MWLFCVSQVPPSIAPLAFPEIREGERVNVMCLVTRGDAPVSIAWERDGAPLTQHQDVSVKALDDLTSVLMVYAARAEHAANYTCTATNAARSVSAHGTLQVKGKGPPQTSLETR